MANEDKWPPNPTTSSSETSEVEAKVIRKVLTVAQTKDLHDDFDQIFEKHDLQRTLRVGAWIFRFINNHRRRESLSGPLTTVEIESVKEWWIKRVQEGALLMLNFVEIQSTLSLQANKDGVLECRGRIQGKCHTYLPDDAMFTRKLVRRAHCETLHRGVGLTMAVVRERFWIPRLRRKW